MRKLLLSTAVLLTSINAFSEVKEIKDVINWQDFDEVESGTAIADFSKGDAHYTLQYRISINPENDEYSFYFYHPKYTGGLLISTDRSEVTKLEVKWNEYRDPMVMFVCGNDSPWESVEAAMGSKPAVEESQKFRYYPDDDCITEVIPDPQYKNYAIILPHSTTLNRLTFVKEFVITRQITVDSNGGCSKVSSLSKEDYSDYFVLATATGKVLSATEDGLVCMNRDMTSEGELYFESEDDTPKLKLGEVGENFCIMAGGQYLGCAADGTLEMTSAACAYKFNEEGAVVNADTQQVIGFDGEKFVAEPVASRAAASVEPLYLMRTPYSDVSTGVEAIADTAYNHAVEYFTLQGVRLSEYPAAPGLYISRQGSTARKFLVK